jgi:hypothetical protein
MLIILKLTDLLEAILLYLVYLVNKDCFAKKIWGYCEETSLKMCLLSSRGRRAGAHMVFGFGTNKALSLNHY